MTVSLQDRLVTGATGARAGHVESAAPAAARPRRRWLDFGQTLDWRQRLLLGVVGCSIIAAGLIADAASEHRRQSAGSLTPGAYSSGPLRVRLVKPRVVLLMPYLWHQ